MFLMPTSDQDNLGDYLSTPRASVALEKIFIVFIITANNNSIVSYSKKYAYVH